AGIHPPGSRGRPHDRADARSRLGVARDPRRGLAYENRSEDVRELPSRTSRKGSGGGAKGRGLDGPRSVQAHPVPAPPAAANSPHRRARTPVAEAQAGRPHRRVLPGARAGEGSSIESRREVQGRRGPDRDRAGDRGSIGVKSAAFALTETPTLDLKTKNVMGIVVPKI